MVCFKVIIHTFIEEKMEQSSQVTLMYNFQIGCVSVIEHLLGKSLKNEFFFPERNSQPHPSLESSCLLHKMGHSQDAVSPESL